MIIVTGIAEVEAGSVEAMKAAACSMAAASRAEAGCRAYAFYEDIEQPGRFRIYEEWETLEALRTHFETPHMAVFSETLRNEAIVRLEVDQFERGQGVTVNP